MAECIHFPDDPNANCSLCIATFIREYVTYKPDVTIRAESDHGHLILTVTRNVPDVYQPDATTGQTFRQELHVIPGIGMDMKFLEHWLTDFFYQLEMHEADEWLKIGGKSIRDPHEKRHG